MDPINDFVNALQDCTSEISTESDAVQTVAIISGRSGTRYAFDGGTRMLGTIRGRHLLTHGPLIVRLFGFRAYVRCLVCTLRGRKTGHVTFLGTVNQPPRFITQS